ncbi:MAG TPA: hypothetical protein VFU79_03320 [Nitrososphaeraceae archaeon]|jgi:hypothetical protein|nr:hypothetical protein [Nitrososphaeraceae archaeon]
MKLTYLMMVLLSSLILSVLSFNLYFPMVNVFAESKVVISSSCGPEEGINININANGFFPNSNVSWVMFDPQLNPLHNGYFATNNTGGFNEDTFAEPSLPGEHTIVFFDDSNLNYRMDNEKNTAPVPITIQCPLEDH